MAMITCRECGHQISDMAVSCPNCGAPVSVSLQQQIPPQQFQQQVPQQQFQQQVPPQQFQHQMPQQQFQQQFTPGYAPAVQPQKNNTALIVGICAGAAVIITLIIVLIVVLGGNGSGSGSGSSSNSGMSSDMSGSNSVSNHPYSYTINSVTINGDYTGGWENNKPEGRGTYNATLNQYGTIFDITLEGEWKNGEFTGSNNTFTSKMEDGSYQIHTGEFQNGELINGTENNKTIYRYNYYTLSEYTVTNGRSENTSIRYFDPQGRELSEAEFWSNFGLNIEE